MRELTKRTISTLATLACMVMFFWSYVGDQGTKDLIFWGVLLLMNFTSLENQRTEEDNEKIEI